MAEVLGERVERRACGASWAGSGPWQLLYLQLEARTTIEAVLYHLVESHPIEPRGHMFNREPDDCFLELNGTGQSMQKQN